jgi:hypothetical protein
LLPPNTQKNGFPTVLYSDEDPAFGRGFVLPYSVSGFFPVPLRIKRQAMIQSNEPTMADLRSTRVCSSVDSKGHAATEGEWHFIQLTLEFDRHGSPSAAP